MATLILKPYEISDALAKAAKLSKELNKELDRIYIKSDAKTKVRIDADKTFEFDGVTLGDKLQALSDLTQDEYEAEIV
jgi:hypothetical protein